MDNGFDNPPNESTIMIRLSMILFIVFILLMSETVFTANIDDVQISLSQSQPSQLHWFNIEGNNGWISGNKPVYKNKRHSTTLQKGEAIQFILPANSILRVKSVRHTLLSHKLTLEQSYDGRIFLKRKLQQAGNDHVLSPFSIRNEASIIKLSANDEEPLNIELYYSSRQAKSQLTHYRKQLDIAAENVSIFSYPDRGIQTFQKIKANQNYKINIKGPVNLNLQSRRPYTESTKLNDDILFKLTVNDNAEESIYFEYSPESNNIIHVAGSPQPVSSLSQHFIHLPDGNHTVVIKSSAEMFFRLLSQDENDYLLFNLNKPGWLSKPNRLADDSFADSWPSSEKEWLTPQNSRDADTPLQLTDRYTSIQSLARNNNINNSGLTAVKKLQNIQADYPLQDTFSQLVNNNKHLHGFYKNLLPATGDKRLSQKTYRITSKRLYRPGEKNRTITDELHVKHYIDQLPTVRFQPLKKAGSINYSAPESNQDSYLRLFFIAKPEQDYFFELLMDNGNKYELRLSNKDITNANFKPAIVKELIESHCCDDYLYRNSKIDISDAAVIILPLAAEVNDFAINYLSSNESGKIEHAPLLGAQVFTSKNYSADEEQYITTVKGHNLKADDLRAAIKNHQVLSATHHLYETEQTYINNNWLALIRKFAEQNKKYTEGINIDNALYPTTSLYPEQRLKDITKLAIKSEQDKQWLAAFEYWIDIVKHSTTDQQQQALSHLYLSMNKLGQTSLSEKLLRALSLQQHNLLIQREAVEFLSKYYALNQSIDSISSLYISLFLQSSDATWLAELISALVEQGQYHYALQLAHLLPEKDWPVDSILLAASQIHWWKTYDIALNTLPDDTQLLKQGHKSFILGDYTNALSLYSEAGEIAQVWQSFTEDVITVKDQLNVSQDNDTQPLFKQWYSLTTRNPSTKIWKKSDWMINKHAGGVAMSNGTLQKETMSYLSSAEQAVEMELAGPLHFRISVMPVLDSSIPITSNDGWYQVVINNEAIDFPIIGSTPSETITIIGQQQRPGNKLFSEFKLGPGIHHLKINSNSPLLVNTHVQQAEIPLPGIDKLSLERYKTIISNSYNTPSVTITNLQHEVIETENYRRMVNYLKLAELNDDNINRSKNILSQAEELYQQNMNESKLKPLLSRIGSSAKWESFNNVTESAGIRQIDHNIWQPESPGLKMYNAIFSDMDSTKRILRSGETVDISVFNISARDLIIKTKLLIPWFLEKQPVELLYQVDNHEKQKLLITDTNNISISLPSGHHRIQLEIEKFNVNKYIQWQLTTISDEVIEEKQRRSYHIATNDEPVEFIIDGPVWLRIDKLYDGATTSKYHFVDQAAQLLTIKPEPQQHEVLIRLFKRVPGDDKADRKVDWQDQSMPFNNYATVEPVLPPPAYSLIDNLPLGEQEDGTLSYEAAIVQRRSVIDEDASSSDDFLQAGATYRYYDDFNDSWHQFEGLYRLRSSNNDSIGIKTRFRDRMNWLSLDWGAKASLYAQQITNSTALGARFDFGVSRKMDIGLKAHHLPRLNIFARVLKLQYLEDEFIDADVFTQYKSEHLYGLNLSDVFYYRPYLDLEYYTGMGITTNENMISLDNTQLILGGRILIGDKRLELNLRNAYYLQDSDRSNSFSKTAMTIKFGWEQWRNQHGRIELAIKLRRDFNLSDNNILIELRYHQNSGRHYRDFMPDEIVFRDLRQTFIPVEANNEIH